MALNYKAGTTANPSSVDADGTAQMNTFFYLKKAIVTARKEQFFMPLANVTNMPKHYGKTIKVHEYIPLLDDRNINDQGIDAAGVTIDNTKFFVSLQGAVHSFAVEADATAAAAAINAIEGGVAVKSGTGPWLVTVSKTKLIGGTQAQAAAVRAKIPTATILQGSGNLYGSSKDIGTITGKLPALGENGGRVNRVGFTRIVREGSINKFGFFYEFTQETLDFDSDDQLMDHLSTELMNGAVQMTEAALQIDLLTSAGVVLYAGGAVSNATVTGEVINSVPASIVTYRTLMRLDQTLTDNRTPKQTKVITGSRLTDTKVIPACRVAYVGSEVVPLLKAMVDLFGNKAFIEVQHYGDAGTILNGEIGSIDAFRFVQVPEMLHWAGAGATVVNNPGFRETNDKYDVFPILVVGDDSFSAIGFQTDGKALNLDVMTKMPGKETMDRNDPYGETGLSSIKWYYGILVKRPERIGLVKTVAPI